MTAPLIAPGRTTEGIAAVVPSALLAAACLAMLISATAPAHATPGAAPDAAPSTVPGAVSGAVPGAVPQPADSTLPARTLPPTPDAAVFCPRPTGHWWHDYTAHGCTQTLTGRDHTHPITQRELSWLDLGALPAYATIDIDAIANSIATYEQHLAEGADEAAESADAPAVAVDERVTAPRSPTTRPPAPPQGTAVSGVERLPTAEELDAMMRECGLDPDDSGFVGEHPCVASLWEQRTAGGGSTPPPSGTAPTVDDPPTEDLDPVEFDLDAPARISAEEREVLRRLIAENCPDGGGGIYFSQTGRPTQYFWWCTEDREWTHEEQLIMAATDHAYVVCLELHPEPTRPAEIDGPGTNGLPWEVFDELFRAYSEAVSRAREDREACNERVAAEYLAEWSGG